MSIISKILLGKNKKKNLAGELLPFLVKGFSDYVSSQGGLQAAIDNFQTAREKNKKPSSTPHRHSLASILSYKAKQLFKTKKVEHVKKPQQPAQVGSVVAGPLRALMVPVLAITAFAIFSKKD